MHLTKRQFDVLEFIRHFRERRGFSPTLEELGQHFGVSKVTIHEHICALEKKGAVRRSKGEARAVEPVDESAADEAFAPLPLLGHIAAGQPIEAVEDRETIDLTDLLARDRECYVLRVRGSSMIEEQIRDGDFVIVEKREAADDGETVVALLNGGDATLKKLYREENRVRLQPANPDMHPIYANPDDVQIQGVVVGVLRKY